MGQTAAKKKGKRKAMSTGQILDKHKNKNKQDSAQKRREGRKRNIKKERVKEGKKKMKLRNGANHRHQETKWGRSKIAQTARTQKHAFSTR